MSPQSLAGLIRDVTQADQFLLASVAGIFESLICSPSAALLFEQPFCGGMLPATMWSGWSVNPALFRRSSWRLRR
jgi:hypothetical protein